MSVWPEMDRVLEHPTITNLRLTGTPDGRERQEASCPICGAQASNYYVRRGSRQVIGCEICLMPVDWWEFNVEEDAG